MAPKPYDIFLSHNSMDKPSARALCRKLEENGCVVFFDDDDMLNEEIAGEKIDEVFENTLVFAGCWGPAGVGPYQKVELDIAFNNYVHQEFNMVTVILPGATSKDPSMKFRSFPPIVFSHLDDTEPVRKLLGVVDRARDFKGLAPRNAGGHDTAKPAAIAGARTGRSQVSDGSGEDDALRGIAEQLRRDAREFGLNFLVGPLTGIEVPTGEDYGAEENVRFPESGEPSPWELAHLLTEKNDLLPKNEGSGRLPLQLVASWLSMGRGDSRLVQSRLKEILRLRRKRNSEFYDRFGQVLRLLLNTAETTRRRQTPAPMIFTTNHGTNMEWNMIYHGVPFTRITVKLPDALVIQSVGAVLEGTSIILSDLNDEGSQPLVLTRDAPETEEDALAFLAEARTRTVNRSGAMAPRAFRGAENEYDRPESTRGLSFDELEGCILFKYHGSIDVHDTCVVNNEQLFELTRIEDLVPAAVEERLKIAPTVVFGTSFLLTEVQQAAEAVWRAPFTSTRTNRYVVPRARKGLKERSYDGWLLELEDVMRDNLKHHASTLNLVEVAPGQEKFLEALQRGLDPDAASLKRSA